MAVRISATTITTTVILGSACGARVGLSLVLDEREKLATQVQEDNKKWGEVLVEFVELMCSPSPQSLQQSQVNTLVISCIAQENKPKNACP